MGIQTISEAITSLTSPISPSNSQRDIAPMLLPWLVEAKVGEASQTHVPPDSIWADSARGHLYGDGPDRLACAERATGELAQELYAGRGQRK